MSHPTGDLGCLVYHIPGCDEIVASPTHGFFRSVAEQDNPADVFQPPLILPVRPMGSTGYEDSLLHWPGNRHAAYSSAWSTRAVLLCQPENGEVAALCLPKGFLDEYADRMSKRDGQMKFNVVRRGSGYSLLVPGTDGINVSRFVGDYSQLK